MAGIRKTKSGISNEQAELLSGVALCEPNVGLGRHQRKSRYVNMLG